MSALPREKLVVVPSSESWLPLVISALTNVVDSDR